MHGSFELPALTADPASSDARAQRIAALSAEYLVAGKGRRAAIAEEIAGLIAGTIMPLARQA